MYYIGQMIKLSYVPNQKELEHEVIDVNGNPVLQDNIRLMSSGAYTSFINDFDTMERNLLLENVGYLISDTMKQIKFKPGSREYNAIYTNVCLNIVRELDGEKPIYFRIEEHIIPFVDVAIEQFKKNFRNSGFMETLYNSVSEDLEMQYIQSDLYKDDYRKPYSGGTSMEQSMNEVFLSMSESDTNALMCNFLYDLKDIPEYATISELCYLLDGDSFKNLIRYFHGKTFRVPEVSEIAEAIQVLKLYNYYEVEGRPWKDAVLLSGFASSSGKLAKNKLDRLKETMKKYNIGNRNY